MLTTLLASTNPQIKEASISALVRKQDQANLLKERGVNPILFNSLDESDVLRKVASEHDIVINGASAFHYGAAEALILGLADRKRKTGKEPLLIHVRRVLPLPPNIRHILTRIPRPLALPAWETAPSLALTLRPASSPTKTTSMRTSGLARTMSLTCSAPPTWSSSRRARRPASRHTSYVANHLRHRKRLLQSDFDPNRRPHSHGSP